MGVGLATAGLFCLTFALIEGQRFSWNAGIMALFAAFVVLAVLFLLQQRRRQDAEPLVPFSLFRNRNFTVINAVAALVSVGDPRLLPAGHDLPAVGAGLLGDQGRADPGADVADRPACWPRSPAGCRTRSAASTS